MARLTATNFSGALQFPYATAATDLFKKEDVQTLAQAVDQHTHAPGFGPPLAAGAIPNGSITSAMIADGSIATADIAPNAVQQPLGLYAAPPTFSTTTLATWVPTPVSVSITSGGGLLRVELSMCIRHSAVGGIALTALGVDGVSGSTLNQCAVAIANGDVFAGWVTYVTPAAGTHTLAVYVYNNNAGTLAISPAIAGLYVTEQKR